jgi:hypothetical protein
VIRLSRSFSGQGWFRWLLVAAVALAASLGTVARADVNNASATNVQEGDNDTETDQEGSASSGDAVAGQVTGVVSSGDTSVDATNRSEDVDVTTGDADGENSATTFTGLNAGSATALTAADILSNAAVNVQEGDNDAAISQAAEASSGDAVGGSVIGVVTSAGGSADVVAANTSEDVDAETGDSEADNSAAAFVGLNGVSTLAIAADILNASATNVQEGDNDLEGDQSTTAATGDAVGGQVLGVVSAGDASVDATNRSEDIDVESGEALAESEFAAFVGLQAGTSTVLGEPGLADIASAAATNLQEGDNSKEVTQSSNAGSGDAVGGQVAGVVTSAGGSADLVLANTSVDSDATTGDAEFFNVDNSFTGLNASGLITVF